MSWTERGLLLLALCGLGFFLTFLYTEHLRNVLLAIFGLTGLVFLVLRRARFDEFQPEAGRLILVFALFFLVALAAWFWGGMSDLGWRKLGRVVNVLFFAPFLAAFIATRPRPEWVWGAMGLGGAFAGAWTLKLFAAQEIERVEGGSHTMTVGGLSLAAGFALLVALPSLWRAGYRSAVVIAACGALGYLITNLGSGVRGPWLALPILVAVWLFWHTWVERRVVHALGGVAAVAVLMVLLFSAPHFERFGRIAAEIDTWFAAERVLPPRDARAGHDCFADPDWLEVYAKRATISPDDGEIVASYQPWTGAEATMLAMRTCLGSSVLWIHNRGDEEVEVDLPRPAPTRTEAEITLSLMASGVGDLRVPGAEAERQAITLLPQVFRITADADRHPHFRLRIPPNSDVRLVPLEERPGETLYFHAAGSADERLDMWAGALAHYRDAPLLGHGFGVYRSQLDEDVAERRASPAVAGQAHPHNEWLYALYSRGLPGLAVLAALFVYPLIVLVRSARSSDPRARAAGMAGSAFIVTVGAFGITQGVFDHNLMVNAFTFVVVTTFWLSRTREP